MSRTISPLFSSVSASVTWKRAVLADRLTLEERDRWAVGGHVLQRFQRLDDDRQRAGRAGEHDLGDVEDGLVRLEGVSLLLVLGETVFLGIRNRIFDRTSKVFVYQSSTPARSCGSGTFFFAASWARRAAFTRSAVAPARRL